MTEVAAELQIFLEKWKLLLAGLIFQVFYYYFGVLYCSDRSKFFCIFKCVIDCG